MPGINASRILSIFLILGGIPPMLSGLIAMISAGTYLGFLGSGVSSMYSPDQVGLLEITWNLQGGDAFVAGSARVAVALIGSDAIKCVLAAIGIGHSLFELWLLPSKLITWCHDTPGVQSGSVFDIGVWFFIVLHVLLVLGFTWGLILKYRESSQSTRLQS
ncbi:MAG: hypothetical protein KC777_00630 [Cyanobacteria bacterium HKST-UBA02]|nr:hypothetical protein [Cyanobacteria bacterium HKST-UBA02]